MNVSRVVFLTCAILVLSNTAHARSEPFIPPEFSCEVDADCVTARSPCGNIRAVNRNYQGQIQAEWDRMSKLVDCAELGVVPEEIPTCSDQKVCVMMPKEGQSHAQ